MKWFVNVYNKRDLFRIETTGFPNILELDIFDSKRTYRIVINLNEKTPDTLILGRDKFSERPAAIKSLFSKEYSINFCGPDVRFEELRHVVWKRDTGFYSKVKKKYPGWPIMAKYYNKLNIIINDVEKYLK